MTGDTWFSSRLRFAIINETLGPVRYDDSVYLLRSTDFEAAFQRALETGRKNQKEYLNGDGQKVNATRFSNTGNRLRQLWGRPPGLRGSFRTRASRNGTSHIRARRGRRGRRAQGRGCAPRITERAQNGKTSGIRQKVVWKLPEVLSLDTIQAESLDGAEIYSEPVPAPTTPGQSKGDFIREESIPRRT